ncbi:hypothetical protein BJ508DRAFT_333726 [Ascobolus immersus RN42]|uniref:Uncharacterized protein n=1 Tax=Ascobolus immersus RN42 TaxID=1160509 RepID=A0A3N4HNW3_ASCIM|nr:hypothetical protein BJ508DRAFT_333726 [Ascobolus immersus RN42]
MATEFPPTSPVQDQTLTEQEKERKTFLREAVYLGILVPENHPAMNYLDRDRSQRILEDFHVSAASIGGYKTQHARRKRPIDQTEILAARRWIWNDVTLGFDNYEQAACRSAAYIHVAQRHKPEVKDWIPRQRFKDADLHLLPLRNSVLRHYVDAASALMPALTPTMLQFHASRLDAQMRGRPPGEDADVFIARRDGHTPEAELSTHHEGALPAGTTHQDMAQAGPARQSEPPVPTPFDFRVPTARPGSRVPPAMVDPPRFRPRTTLAPQNSPDGFSGGRQSLEESGTDRQSKEQARATHQQDGGTRPLLDVRRDVPPVMQRAKTVMPGGYGERRMDDSLVSSVRGVSEGPQHRQEEPETMLHSPVPTRTVRPPPVPSTPTPLRSPHMPRFPQFTTDINSGPYRSHEPLSRPPFSTQTPFNMHYQPPSCRTPEDEAMDTSPD